MSTDDDEVYTLIAETIRSMNRNWIDKSIETHPYGSERKRDEMRRERVLRHGTVIVWEFFTGGKTLKHFFRALLLLFMLFLSLYLLLRFYSCFVYTENFYVYLFYVGEEHTDMQSVFRSSAFLSSQFRSLFTVSTIMKS